MGRVYVPCTPLIESCGDLVQSKSLDGKIAHDGGLVYSPAHDHQDKTPRNLRSDMNDLPGHEISDLLNRIERDDNQAVGKLYRHYQQAVHAFIRRRVPDDAAAEEILIDTFLVMCRKPGAFDGTSKFSTWLCGIARNKALDWLRAHGRQAELVEIDEEVIETAADPDWDILDRLERKEESEVLRRCVDQLPLAQREAAYWVWYQDEKLETVAERLDCPLGTVKSRLHHARSSIRDCVERAFGRKVRHG